MTKFVHKTDFSERVKQTEVEIWEELAKKQDKTVFSKKFQDYEDENEQQKKQVNKDLCTLRELFDRMRRKTEESILAMIEIRSEIDLKMSSKEG